MLVQITGPRNVRYVFLLSALLAGLWLASSAFAVSLPGHALSGKISQTPPNVTSPLSAPGNSTGHADTPGALLVAHLTWQGIAQPNHRNTTETFNLMLRLDSGGPLVQYGNVATDASGYVTVPVDSLAAGTYNYQAKGLRSLARGGQVTLAGDPVTSVEMGTMRAGDGTNDNVVDARDFSTLKADWGGQCGFCGQNLRSDFNKTDNVDATDFSLMKGNFGSGGAPPP